MDQITPKLTLLAINLTSSLYVSVSDHQGDHSMKVPKPFKARALHPPQLKVISSLDNILKNLLSSKSIVQTHASIYSWLLQPLYIVTARITCTIAHYPLLPLNKAFFPNSVAMLLDAYVISVSFCCSCNLSVHYCYKYLLLLRQLNLH
jgi:hypothetical protein